MIQIPKLISKIVNSLGRTLESKESLPIKFYPTKGRTKPRILIFTPEAGVSHHYFKMCVVAKTLQELGFEVWIFRCSSSFERCPTMSANRLPFKATVEQTKSNCTECLRWSSKGLNDYGLPFLEADWFDSEISSIYQDAIAHLPRDLMKFRYDGVDFGRLTSFELSVTLKRTVLNSEDSELRIAWISYIRSAIKAYLLVSKILEKHDFSHVAYFENYSIMMAAFHAAERNGAKTRLITEASHRNVDRRRCVVYQKHTAANHYNIHERWPEWRELPIANEIVQEISEDTLHRFRGLGSHIYSPPRTTLEQSLNLSSRRHQVVLYTSSPDEVAGLIGMLPALGLVHPPHEFTFGGKIEEMHANWLGRVILHFAQNPECELVIRIHPREGVNKREAITSQHLERLQKVLVDLPENCTVIWPADPISSYDISEKADLILVGWSTIGLEMARLGVPVLCASRGISGFVVDDFQEFTPNPEEYFRLIGQLLKAPPSFGKLRRSYRWWNLFVLANSVDLSDLIPSCDYWGLPEFHLPKRARDLERTIIGDENIFDLNHQRLTNEQNEDSCLEESLALQLVCRRILYYLFFGKDRGGESNMAFLKDEANTVEEFLTNHPWVLKVRRTVLVVDLHRQIILVENGCYCNRFSPMAARLAFFGAQQHFVPAQWSEAAPPTAKRLSTFAEAQNLP